MARFDDLDSLMRSFEAARDVRVAPRMHVIVRLDGRGFTTLTKQTLAHFERPFDVRFRDAMVEATRAIMTHGGFEIVYGYTQSDEISLVLSRDDQTFSRKESKLLSVLSSMASAHCSLALGQVACFDARLLALPTPDLIVDYMQWRAQDAFRNAVSAHCYWLLRDGQGLGARQATARLEGASAADKRELLRDQAGMHVNDLPCWQRRGVGLSWETYIKQGVDPRTGQTREATRRRLTAHMELPFGPPYEAFVARIIAGEDT